MNELKGRVALVTGAARGIGAATARALAAAGATVIAADIADCGELAAEIGGSAVRLDVTEEAQWEAAVAHARSVAGGLDILVNNAGVFAMTPLAELTLEEWRRVHAVNLDGVFLGCKHAAPVIAERAGRWLGGGVIINLSSVAGLSGGANYAAYASSKGAVRLLSKSLAIELGPARIRVVSVHPGLIETPMGQQVVDDLSRTSGISSNEARSALTGAHVLGHTGETRDIADSILFLASDRAKFITGTEFVVDGGMTA